MGDEPSRDGIQEDSDGTPGESKPDQNTNGGVESPSPQEASASINPPDANVLAANSHKGDEEAEILGDSGAHDLHPGRHDRGRTMTPAEKLMSILTLLIFLATAANVWVFYLESEDTSQKMVALSNKAGDIVGTMNTALSNNQDAISKAFEANRTAVEGSERQSNAALRATIDASRRDLRPYVMPVDIVPALGYRVQQGGGVKFLVHYLNFGKSPATDIRVSSWPVYEGSALSVEGFFDMMNHSMKGAWTTGHQTFQAPTVVGSIPDTAIAFSPFFLSADQFNAIRINDHSLFVVGRIEYRDVLGTLYYTDFCRVNRDGVNGDQFTMTQVCQAHNEVH